MNDLRFPTTTKAEVLINVILDYYTEIYDIRVKLNGTFQRNYLEDISHVDFNIKNSIHRSILVELNRDGLYDKLPEGLFHKIDRFVKLGSSGTQSTFKEEYENQKNEIEYSRKFFNPFDNLFFKMSLMIEKKFMEYTSNANKTIYSLFFGGSSGFDLPKNLLNKIITFLPYLSKLRANIEYLEFFLSYLLIAKIAIKQNETVTCHTINSSLSYNVLNKTILGRNFSCGNKYMDFFIEWVFTIEVPESRLNDLLEGDEFGKLFNFIKSYCIPAGITSKLDIRSYSYHQFELLKNCSSEKRQYLNYNIYI